MKALELAKFWGLEGQEEEEEEFALLAVAEVVVSDWARRVAFILWRLGLAMISMIGLATTFFFFFFFGLGGEGNGSAEGFRAPLDAFAMLDWCWDSLTSRRSVFFVNYLVH